MQSGYWHFSPSRCFPSQQLAHLQHYPPQQQYPHHLVHPQAQVLRQMQHVSRFPPQVVSYMQTAHMAHQRSQLLQAAAAQGISIDGQEGSEEHWKETPTAVAKTSAKSNLSGRGRGTKRTRVIKRAKRRQVSMINDKQTLSCTESEISGNVLSGKKALT